MVPTALVEAFAEVCTKHRNRIAIVGLSEGVTRTFDELHGDTLAMTRALRTLPLPFRPTIVSAVGNRVGFIPLLLASLQIEAGLLTLDGDATTAELTSLIDSMDADALILPIGDARSASEQMLPLPCGLAVRVRARTGQPSWRKPHETAARILRLTSGSSGRPRIVAASDVSLVHDGRHLIEAMGISDRDVALATVPMSHAYGMGVVLMPLLLRGSSVVMRDGFVPSQLAVDLRSCGITMVPGVPFMFGYLRRLGPDVAPLSSLRLIVTAGAPIEQETLRFFKDEYGQKLHSLYGTSETGGIAFDASDELHETATVGTPLAETTVSLVATPGARLPEGRIHVRGPAVCLRYLNDGADEPARSQLTVDGFLSGDLGTFDASGALSLTGRVSHFINVAGRKVNPQEVERVIAQLAGVEEVSVLGASCPQRGQIVVACVRRPKRKITAAEIRAHCARYLSPHKAPRQIIFVDEVPVDRRGKTVRQNLEALVQTALTSAEDI